MLRLPIVGVLLAVALVLGIPPERSPAAARRSLAAFIVVDAATGQVLASSHAAERRPIASITKLMTAYLAIRAGALGRTFVVPQSATRLGQSTVRLRAGQRVSGRTLLEAVFVPSANDAAETLAVGVSGSRAAFVLLMNRTAARLGLHNTVYRSPDGLDAPGQRSSAADVALLARLLVADERVLAIASERSMRVGGARYVARNTLLGHYAGLDGLKTGHTRTAGWCLVATASRQGRRVIVVALGAPDQSTRDRAVRRLLDAAFGGRRGHVPRDGAVPRRVPVLRAGTQVVRLSVAFGDSVAVAVARDLLLDPQVRGRVTLRYVVPTLLAAPVDVGATVGAVALLQGGRVVARSPLIAAGTVAEPGGMELLGWLLSPLRSG